MTCETCLFYEPPQKQPIIPGVSLVYGWCRPPFARLPFWAATYRKDMQIRTRVDEGFDCEAWEMKDG